MKAAIFAHDRSVIFARRSATLTDLGFYESLAARTGGMCLEIRRFAARATSRPTHFGHRRNTGGMASSLLRG
jgi:hypothetical protein